MFTDKSLMRFYTVRTDPKNFRIKFCKFSSHICKITGFFCAAGSVILRIKIKNDVLSRELSHLLESLTFPEEMAREICQIRQEILSGLEPLGGSISDLSQPASDTLLKEIASGYVMEQQRKIHHKVVEEGTEQVEAEDDLGDNIELF